VETPWGSRNLNYNPRATQALPKRYPSATQALPEGYPRATQGSNTGATPEQHRSTSRAPRWDQGPHKAFPPYLPRGSQTISRTALSACSAPGVRLYHAGMTEPEPLQQTDRTYVRFRQRKLSYFSGCDYFRLASHPRVMAAMQAGVKKYGLNVAASRMTTGNHVLYRELEAQLADFFAAESALLVSCGYMTNLVVAQALTGHFSHALIDASAHPSLADARKNWYIPGKTPEPADTEPGEAAPPPPHPPAFPIAHKPARPEAKHVSPTHAPGAKSSTRIEIEPVESEFGKILKRPGE